MFFKKIVKDIMVPIDNYTVVSIDKSLKDAITAMRKVYCEVETGRCTEAGHRASLVVNEYGHLSGIVDFRAVLETLIPNIAEELTDKLTSHGKASFMERIMKEAEVKVGDIMIDISGYLKVDDDLLQAVKVMHKNKAAVLPVYEGDKLVGVLRDSDLFLVVAAVFTE